jgi:uncharacterized protein YrrD
MKPTKEIIGLRIISILDGTQVGVIKDLVLNPQEKRLDFLIVDQPTDIFGAKIIAFADVCGLGEFALTIPSAEVIQDVIQNIDAQNLLKHDIRVLGTKVLTKKGQLIGEVTEIFIDEETGCVAGCLFESQGQTYQVGIEQIITLGKELLIIEGLPTELNLQIIEPDSENKIQTSDASVLNVDAAVAEADRSAKIDEEAVSFTEKETFNLFEQRQLQYFIGKKVEKDIVLDNKEVLRAGEIISPDIVAHIKTRNTLMEITSHLQKN